MIKFKLIYFIKIFLIFLFLFSLFTFAYSENLNPIVIPFHYNEHGQIILEATINGYKENFIFDKGSMNSFSQIDGAGLASLNNCTCISCNVSICCCNPFGTTIYLLDKIQFGDTIVNANSLLIDSKRRQILRSNSRILGFGIFEGFWMELSFSRNEIILHTQIPEHFANAAHSPLVMPDISNSRLYLAVYVDGNEWFMALDTALPFAFYFPYDIISSVEPHNIIGQVLSNGEIKNYNLIRANSITILDNIFYNKFIFNKSYTASRANWKSFTNIGLIGMEYLRNYDLLLDLRDINNHITTGMYYIPIIPPIDRDYGYTLISEVPKTGIISYHHYGWCIMISDILSDNILGLHPGSVITRIGERKIIDIINTHELLYLLENADSITVLIDRVEVEIKI